MSDNYQLYCCGSRGSRPIEGIRFNEFGGFTSCYVLKTDDYALIIDCGTGLYEASPIILDCSKVDVVLTHMHYDHMLGMLDWDTLNQKVKTTFYSGFSKWYGDKTFDDFFRKPFWPVQPKFDLKETPKTGERLNLRKDLSIEFFEAPHPDDSQRMIIRLKQDDGSERSIAIMFDNEVSTGIDNELLRNCDYLLYDGMYTDYEYESKKGYGHSTWQEGVRLATKVNCKRLIITHHSPFRTDEQLRTFESKARDIYPATDFARAGQHWDFPNNEEKQRVEIKQEKTPLIKKIKETKEKVKEILIDEEKMTRFLTLGSMIILSLVSIFMTIVNIFTKKHILMFSTLVFALFCIANALIEYYKPKLHNIVLTVFQIEFIVLLTFFVVSGTPEGFSAIWTLMLPIAGNLLFGVKRTVILSAIMEFILLFFFETPLGRSYLQYEYTNSFMLRFPMAFFAFFLIGLFLASSRELLKNELNRIKRDQAKTIANQTAELRSQYFDIVGANSKLQLRNKILQNMIGEDVSDDKIKEMLPKDEEKNNA